MQLGPMASRAFRNTEELEIVNFWSPIQLTMTDQRYLTSAITRRSLLTAEPQKEDVMFSKCGNL
jgi:hypothetical protein